MTNRKALRGSRTHNEVLPDFIHERGAEEQVQISIRIPSTLKNRFDAAQQLLHGNQLEMNLSDVVRMALQDACAVVELRFCPKKNQEAANG